MLGSRTAADDAVQETWLRLRSADADAVENLGGWLTTVVSRVSIDMLRARQRGDAPRPETDDVWADGRVVDPVEDVVVADSVSAALVVVLEIAGLIELLDPEIVMNADQRAAAMGAEATVEGPDAVASVFSGRALGAQTALIDGGAGMVWATDGQLRVVWDFTIEDGLITHINMLADPKPSTGCRRHRYDRPPDSRPDARGDRHRSFRAHQVG